ncbi:MAG: polysaccharide deacetylase family protein [Actinomycetota bacterium]|nr:polysaccharide deacetylase family protein [Actinomycetota bacterium]
MSREQREERRRRERARMQRQRRFVVAGCLLVFVLLVAAGANPSAAHRRLAVAPSFVPPQYLDPLLRPEARRATAAEQYRLAVERFLQLGYPVYCGGGTKRLVALTLDDGPGPWSGKLVRILTRRHARATFFLVGRQILDFPRAPALERQVGVLGNHTWSHPYFSAMKRSAIKVEVQNGGWALNRLASVPVSLFRPPYGEHSPAVDTIVRDAGLLQVMWSVDARDYVDRTWPQVGANIVSAMRPGSIVLMHELHSYTVEALRRRVLPAMRRRHLWPVTVPELLAEDPPSLAQLRTGVRGCRR